MVNKATILIVEDNEANLRLAETTLAMSGYDVLLAASCEEALRAISKKMPDVILMDLQLPDMDGLQLTTQLKQNIETNKIIIIAVTAYAMDTDRDKALKAGCDGYLVKPYNVFKLANLIESYLRKG